MSGSGRGSDNAHNNQFGGGGRGPSGGVNTGPGNSDGNAGNRGNGYWQADPRPSDYPGGTFINGEVRITIDRGVNWVSDNGVRWSDGKGGNGNDNLRTNATAKVDNGYRAAVDGFIYVVTVDGQDAITGVHLYSRPATASRRDWAQNEGARTERARALVQAQLDEKKAQRAAREQQAANAAAAAEARRREEEDAQRRQAEWDAAHPVEAAQRKYGEAEEAVRQAEASKIAAQNAYNGANHQVNERQAEYNQALEHEAVRKQEFDKVAHLHSVPSHLPHSRYFRDMQQLYASAERNSAQKKSALDAAISARQAPENALHHANNAYHAAVNHNNIASAALTSALQVAQAKRDAEARRQADAEAALKAANEAEARRQAEAAAQARAAAEAATKAAALEAAMSKLEQPNVFAISGYPSEVPAQAGLLAAPLIFAETGLGASVLNGPLATLTWTAVRAVLADLIGAALAGSGVGALIASVAYVPAAGEGSDKVPGRGDMNMFMSAMPADAINLPDENILNAAAEAQGTVDMAVRGRVYFSDNVLKTYLVRTTTPSPVRVLSAVRDDVTGLYAVTIPAESELPSRTILVSPDKTPGYQGLPPLVTPHEIEAGLVNTGNQTPDIVTPVIESFPMADDLDFRDAILIFPADTGMKPLYVMLQSGRDLPGTVEGKGADVEGAWLAGVNEGQGVPIPTRIADKLRGREFRNFDEFRGAMWYEISRDPELARQFKNQNLTNIQRKNAPFAREEHQVGGRERLEIHHIKPISEGGAVYDIDNLGVTTPMHHIEIHSKKEGKAND